MSLPWLEPTRRRWEKKVRLGTEGQQVLRDQLGQQEYWEIKGQLGQRGQLGSLGQPDQPDQPDKGDRPAPQMG